MLLAILLSGAFAQPVARHASLVSAHEPEPGAYISAGVVYFGPALGVRIVIDEHLELFGGGAAALNPYGFLGWGAAGVRSSWSLTEAWHVAAEGGAAGQYGTEWYASMASPGGRVLVTRGRRDGPHATAGLAALRLPWLTLAGRVPLGGRAGVGIEMAGTWAGEPGEDPPDLWAAPQVQVDFARDGRIRMDLAIWFAGPANEGFLPVLRFEWKAGSRR